MSNDIKTILETYLLIVFSNTTNVSQQNQAIYHEIVAVKPDLNL